MSLTTELLKVLDNNNEPLSKRLKIAHNAYNSTDFKLLKKENVLLNWLHKTEEIENSAEVWETLNLCIKSQHTQNLNSNDIKQNIFTNIITSIITKFETKLDTKLKETLIKCSVSILTCDLFLQYFKHDMMHYCKFVGTLLINIDDINLLNKLFEEHLIFNKKIVIEADCRQNFFTYTFNSFIAILIKYKSNTSLFKECVQITQNVLFPFNSKEFVTYLDEIFDKKETTNTEPHDIVNQMKIFYKENSESAQCAFRLILFAFKKAYKTNTQILFKFLIFLLQMIGFDVRKQFEMKMIKSKQFDLEKSLIILSDIFEMISTENVIILEDVNDISFNKFIKTIIKSVIQTKQVNLSVLNIIKYAININPLIVDNLIKDILILIMLTKKDKNIQILYSELMISLLEMFFKLHLVFKFCGVLLNAIKNSPKSDDENKELYYQFLGKTKRIDTEIVTNIQEILPENFVNYFYEIVTQQWDKQIILIFKKFNHKLNSFINNLHDQVEDVHKITYIQVASTLICQFLAGIRLAEHTTIEKTLFNVLEKMNELKIILGKYAGTLLEIEHNHILIFSFLNICYMWGEVTIMLTYYASIENINLKGNIDIDYSANNLTYLHNYLTTAQWSLISQRIKNFGEQPCKHILQKLIIQKLRAILLFEPEIPENIQTSVVSSYSSNLDTSWDIIFTERFISAVFIPKLETSQLITLADLLITDVGKKNNFDFFKKHSVIECRDLVTSLLYVCLSKINNLFKKKRKLDDVAVSKTINTNILKAIDSETFIKSESVNVENLIILLNETVTNFNIKIDENKFCFLMEIIKQLPIYFLSHEVQITLFLYLLSICKDLKDCKKENSLCVEKCENYLIGIIENSTCPNILKYENSNIITKLIIELLDKYKEVLKHAINLALQNNEYMLTFKSSLNEIIHNASYTASSDNRQLNCCILTLNEINGFGQGLKHTEESKLYLAKLRSKIAKKLLKFIVENDDITDLKAEAFIVTIHEYLIKNNDNGLEKLNSFVQQYFNYAINNINENNAETCFCIFNIILQNKSAVLNFPTDFMLTIWNSLKLIECQEKYEKNFIKAHILIFEHLKIKSFVIVLKELLDTALNFLHKNETDHLVKNLNIWINLMESSLSLQKMGYVRKSLQTLLQSILIYMLRSGIVLDLYDVTVDLQLCYIKNKKFPQTHNLINIYFQYSEIIICKEHNFDDFIKSFDKGFLILETLGKKRTELVVDRLPSFFAHFKIYLNELCKQSNSEKEITHGNIFQLANCAFRMELLLKHMSDLKKDIMRISPFVIADILKEYETFTLFPEIKTHLNNCLNILFKACDEHAVKYLFRVLSPASRVFYKTAHDNYKKYYKFTGKV